MITTNELIQALKTQFRLEGQLETIYSELDAVYKLTTDAGKRYVVKFLIREDPGQYWIWKAVLYRI